MAAVSDGSEKPLEDCIDYDLQTHLKGLNTATPDLSTLAQKGDEKVRRDRRTLSLFCKFKRMSGVNLAYKICALSMNLLRCLNWK